MKTLSRLDAFSLPFVIEVVEGQIVAKSQEAPVELAFTAECASDTAHRLLLAAELLRQISKGK